jgi:hypothetical protein
LQDAIKKYDSTLIFTNLHIRNVFINLIGPGIGDIITEREIWSEFATYLISILKNQVVQIKGIIIPYASLKVKPDTFLRYKDLGRLIPLILDVSNTFDFYLEPSMLTDNPEPDYLESLYCITKVFNGNGFTHLMVGGDLMQSNIVIEKRIEQYTTFMNNLATVQKKAFGLKQICDKMCQLLKENKDAINDINAKDFIKSKLDSFCQKKNIEEPVTPVPKENKPTPSVGFYDKCKCYLLNTTNNVLGLFGLSLASKS